MSGHTYRSQLVEDIKEIEEDSRELRKQLKVLKKRKRKQKRLEAEDEVMLELCERDLEINETELHTLRLNISQINIKEEEEVKETKEEYAY